MTTLIGPYPLSEENTVVQRLRSLYLSIIKEESKGPLPSLALTTLSLLSCPYYTAIRLRELMYRYGVLEAATLPVPVISVGTITMGGTAVVESEHGHMPGGEATNRTGKKPEKKDFSETRCRHAISPAPV